MTPAHRAWLFACGCMLCSVGQVHAQAAGVEIKPLLRTTPSTDPRMESLVVTAVFQPGASTGRHSHPGDEYATLIEGRLELRVEGQVPRHVEAGEAYHNRRGVIHETLNPGTVPARVVSTFIVSKDQALVQPAP